MRLRTIVLIGISAVFVGGVITLVTVKTPTRRALSLTVHAEGRLASDVETEVSALVTARFEARARDEEVRDGEDSAERAEQDEDEAPRVEGVVCRPDPTATERVVSFQCDVTYVASLPLCMRLPVACGPFGPGGPPPGPVVLAPRPPPPAPIMVSAPSPAPWPGPPSGGGSGPAPGGGGIGPEPPRPVWLPPLPPMPMPMPPAPIITPMPIMPMPMLFMRVR